MNIFQNMWSIDVTLHIPFCNIPFPWIIIFCYFYPFVILFSCAIIWASLVAQLVKNPPANARDARDVGSVPGWGKFPGEVNGNPLQYSCLENSVDGGAWRATGHGIVKSCTQLTAFVYTYTHTHTHTHTHCNSPLYGYSIQLFLCWETVNCLHSFHYYK